MRLRLERTGPAAPARVWGRCRRPARWTDWAPHLSSVRTEDAVLRPGTRGTVVALGLVPARFTVTAVRPRARTWSWTVRVGPVRLDLVHDVRRAPGGGSTAGVVITGPAPVLLAYRPVLGWAVRRLVAR